ncbi:MAG: hypothetical protein KGR26_06105, partial [Cyanobacteria bacterium REEB65]|nr:hypothetical protein [Cyanobacteria bacterium REEB65]
MASILIVVPDERPLMRICRQIFAQPLKDLEILIMGPVSREDAQVARRETGHDLPIRNLRIEGPPGKGINEAARTATGYFIVTLCHQARFRDDRWLVRLLEPFVDGRMAAVSGCDYDPTRIHCQQPSYVLTLADYLCSPRFGIGLQTASFRRQLLLEQPFDEQLPLCADKEWTFRMLCAGWRIQLDHEARVDLPVPEDSEAALRRFWREHQAIASFLDLPGRASFLLRWAWSRRDFNEVLHALQAVPKLRRLDLLERNLRGALTAR